MGCRITNLFYGEIMEHFNKLTPDVGIEYSKHNKENE
jgi:hypothetical protein